MGLLDKVKNLFTEEIEEVKKEVRQVEIPSPKRVDIQPKFEPKIEPKKEETMVTETPILKEEKFVFFDDKDFDDLKKPVEELKPVIKKEVVNLYQASAPYQGNRPATPKVEEKKRFAPTPIISPVYGILDKNYHKEDIKVSKDSDHKEIQRNLDYVTVDDIRKKAFGTLEDELESELINREVVVIEETRAFEEELETLNIFEELQTEPIEITESDEELTDLLIEEFDNDKKVEKTSSENFEELDELLDDDTEELSKQLEEQKKKLEQINEFIQENESTDKTTKNIPRRRKTVEIEEETEDDLIDNALKKLKEEPNDDLTESELFSLIDSMYEKKEDE